MATLRLAVRVNQLVDLGTARLVELQTLNSHPTSVLCVVPRVDNSIPARLVVQFFIYMGYGCFFSLALFELLLFDISLLLLPIYARPSSNPSFSCFLSLSD